MKQVTRISDEIITDMANIPALSTNQEINTKKAYTAPALKLFGKVSELTQAGSSGGKEQGATMADFNFMV